MVDRKGYMSVRIIWDAVLLAMPFLLRECDILGAMLKDVGLNADSVGSSLCSPNGLKPMWNRWGLSAHICRRFRLICGTVAWADSVTTKGGIGARRRRVYSERNTIANPYRNLAGRQIVLAGCGDVHIALGEIRRRFSSSAHWGVGGGPI